MTPFRNWNTPLPAPFHIMINYKVLRNGSQLGSHADSVKSNAEAREWAKYSNYATTKLKVGDTITVIEELRDGRARRTRMWRVTEQRPCKAAWYKNQKQYTTGVENMLKAI